MDKESIFTLLGLLIIGYFILRSIGSQDKAIEPPPPVISVPPLVIPTPSLTFQLPQKKPEKLTDAKIRKPSRAAAIRRLAYRGKDWVVLNEILKKKFTD
jgi:hypothetical protein